MATVQGQEVVKSKGKQRSGIYVSESDGFPMTASEIGIRNVKGLVKASGKYRDSSTNMYLDDVLSAV